MSVERLDNLSTAQSSAGAGDFQPPAGSRAEDGAGTAGDGGVAATKPWWASKTIVAVLLAWISEAAKPLGLIINDKSPELMDLALFLIVTVLSGGAIIGRVRASGAITWKGSAK